MKPKKTLAVMFVHAALFVGSGSDAQRVDSCFSQEDPPSCQDVPDTDQVLADIPLWEETCVLLDQDFLAGVDFQQSESSSIVLDALSSIPANSELCDHVRLYFPVCLWCRERNNNNEQKKEREQHVACFDQDHPPACHHHSNNSSSTELLDNIPFRTVSANCLSMKDHLEAINGVDRLFDLSQHAVALASFKASPEWCDSLRQTYSLCYWCTPGLDDGSSSSTEDDKHDFCGYESLCLLPQPDETDAEATAAAAITTTPTDENLNKTCSELEILAELSLAPLTIDLCSRAGPALRQRCRQFCSLPRCFDETTHPASCQHATPDDDGTDGDHSISSACASMWAYHLRDFPHDLNQHTKALSQIFEMDEECNDYRRAYPHCYWCAGATDDASSTTTTMTTTNDEEPVDCPNLDFCVNSTTSRTILDEEEEADEIESICENDLRPLLKYGTFPSTIDLCSKAERFSQYCACTADPDLQYNYLGADTAAKKRALVWLSRTAALLSFVGASYILWDALSNKKNRTTVYHQLLVGMACFDICTAVAWGFATAPIPDDQGYSIVGAVGNDATCATQGFFVQLGFASVFYNVSLSAYYWMVIVGGWREFALRKVRPLFHGPPLLIGLALAFGGIPFYRGFDYGCHIEPMPFGELWQVLIFTVVPIGFSILSITITMVALYMSVRRKSQAARRWRFGQSAEMEKKVFWQAFFYTLSFYVTWPIVFLVYIWGLDTEKQNYGFSALVSFVAPLTGLNNLLLQGFNNFCVIKLYQSKAANRRPRFLHCQ